MSSSWSLVRRPGPWLVAAAWLVAAGCYRYTAIEAAPGPGRDVRVDLTAAGSARLESLIGPRIEALDGRAVGSTDTSLVLAVSAAVERSGLTVHWSQERVDVPRSAISRVRGRELDRKRTWLVAALGVAGVVLLGDAFGLGNGLDGLFGSRGGGTRQ
jgi:hypothetical protein